MARYKQVMTLAIASLSMTLLAGCSTSTDADKIGDAQYCLDDLPISFASQAERTASVNACLDKLGSVSSKQASLIRCSANFLIEGFGDPSKLVNALEKVNNGGGGNATVGMMSVLAFSSKSTATENAAFAQQTLSYCQEAGNPGFVLVASFSNIASALAKAGEALGGVNLNDGLSQQELTTILESAQSMPDEVIGSTAIAAYQTSCAAGSQSNEALCSQLSQSLANNTDPSAIGAALRDQWKK